MSEIRFFHFSGSGQPRRLSNLSEALIALSKTGHVWLDYYDPSMTDLTNMAESLGFHPLSIEDCINDNQVPKLEDFPNHTFIIFNAYGYVENQLLIEEVNFFIGQKFLVTIHGHNQGYRHFTDELYELVLRDVSDVQKGPDFLLHVVLDYIVDKKFLAIDTMENELNRAEEHVLSGSTEFRPGDILQLRKELLTLRKSLFNEREIMVKICRKDSRFISERAIYHFRDIYDHLAKFFELTEIYREMVTTLMEVHLSMINNEMARASNDTNTTVRRLTFITTVFMPLTLLAGIGGMSEWSMMTGPENWRISYPLFLLGMLLIGSVSYYSLQWAEKRLKNRN